MTARCIIPRRPRPPGNVIMRNVDCKPRLGTAWLDVLAVLLLHNFLSLPQSTRVPWILSSLSFALSDYFSYSEVSLKVINTCGSSLIDER